MRDRADSYRSAGSTPEAIAGYLEALPLLRATAPRGYVDALRKLAGTYADAGDSDNAVARYRQALEAYAGASDLGGVMVVELEIGMVCFRAERYGDATAAFEEAARIADTLNAAEAGEAARGMLEKISSQATSPEPARTNSLE